MKKKGFFTFLSFLLISAAISLFMERYYNVSIDDVRLFVSSWGILGPAAYAVLLFLGITVPFDPIPDLLVIGSASFLFSPLESIIATFIAHSASLFVDYHLAKKYGESFIKRFLSPGEIETSKQITDQMTPAVLFWLRFIPPLSTALGIDILSYLAGLQKMRFATFFGSSIIPWTTLSIVYFMGTYFLKDRSIFTYILPGLLVIGIPSLIWSVQTERSRRRKN